MTAPAADPELIGRAAERAALQALLADGARLVTLVGPPGIGKSRLARAALAGGPAVRCPLRPVVDGVGALRAVADALGLPLDADQAVIGRALAARPAPLLWLDDGEHVAAALAPVVAAWLEGAPALRVVVTSRLPLDLPAEHRLEVGPLAGPTGPHDLGAPAAQLFLACARRVAPGLDGAGIDRAALGQILDALGGVPLALELAASRLDLLSLPALAARLDAQLVALLARPAGHSLQAAIDTSWALLAPAEQGAFAALSLFRGPFSLADAEALLGDADGPALDRVHALRRHSLLQATAGPGGDMRLGLLEALRQYARARFEARPAPWRAQHHRRHAVRVLDPARGPSGSGALREVAAWALAQPGDDTEATAVALRAALALDALWADAPADAVIAVLDAALARAAGGATARALQADGWTRRGVADRHRGRRPGRLAAFDRALALAREAGDAGALGRACLARATWHVDQVEGQAARAWLAQAKAAFERAGDSLGQAAVARELGNAARRDGALAEARLHYEAGLAVAQAGGHRREEAVLLGNLGGLAQEAGRLTEAGDRLRRSRATLLTVGDDRSAAIMLGNLGFLLMQTDRLGEADEALGAAAEALAQLGALTYSGIFEGSRAEGALLGGRPRAALAHAEAGLARMGDAEAVYGALFTVMRAAALALAGDLPAARAAAAAGEGAVAALPDPYTRQAAALYLAQIAVAAGDLDAAAAARAAVPAADYAASYAVRSAAHLLDGALAAQRAARAEAQGAALRVAADGAWFQVPDSAAPVSLARRQVLQRLLAALAASREASPGQPTPAEALVAQTWPGERILPAAARNRLHVAVASLRKLGLGRLLIHSDEGYALSAGVPFARVAAGE